MKNVGLIKRAVVMIYDGLLLFGVTLVGYGVVYLVLQLLPASFEASLFGKIFKILYLLTITFIFYGWFWTHGGQTLGMKVWNLFLINQTGKFIGWWTAAARYCAAAISWGAIAGILYFMTIERWYLAIGLGFVWSLIDKYNLTWHDIFTSTRIVQLPKNNKSNSQID